MFDVEDAKETLRVVDQMVGRSWTGFGLHVCKEAARVKISMTCKVCKTLLEIDTNYLAPDWAPELRKAIVEECHKHSKTHQVILLPGNARFH
jgi:hypothetical protein